MMAQTVEPLLQGIENPGRPAQHVKLDGALIQRGFIAPVREWTMRGFDSKWRDVPDFVIGITRQIWEDRDIGSLRTHYADGLMVRSPASVLRDNSRVIGATIATLAEFPDRALLGEDVIWCDDPEGATDTSDADPSSHRLCCTATHCHPGLHGAPDPGRLRDPRRYGLRRMAGARSIGPAS